MYFKLRKSAFSIAEALITLMIISLVLAAVVPVVSRRQMVSDKIWKYVESGTGANSNVYYGLGKSQVAILGSDTLPSESIDSRLTIVIPPETNDDTIKRSIIDFYQKTTTGIAKIGKISFDKKNNIAIGRNSMMEAKTTGSENTAVGNKTLIQNSTGSFNSAFGSAALNNNTTGQNNSGFGFAALSSNTTGQHNTAVGFAPLAHNSTGICNTAIGGYSLNANETSSYNSAFGYYSLTNNTNGENNSAFGSGSLAFAKSGSNNTAIGINAMRNINGAGSNTAVGANALAGSEGASLYGTFNVAVGSEALLDNTSGFSNVAVGPSSLTHNKTAQQNVGIGNKSLFSNLAGDWNTAVGSNALYKSTGESNTAIGTRACEAITSGSNNVCLGFYAGPSSGVSNSKLYIDIAQTNDPLIFGDFSTDEVKVNGKFRATSQTVLESDFTVLGPTEFRDVTTFNQDVYGRNFYGDGFMPSDKRLKTDIKDYNSGLDKILKFNVKEFVYKKDKSKTKKIGVIAQEIQNILPGSVKKNKDGYLNIETNQFIFLLVNSIKDMYKQLQSLVVKVSGLDMRIKKLEKENKQQKLQINQLSLQIAQTNKQNAIINQRLSKLERKK